RIAGDDLDLRCRCCAPERLHNTAKRLKRESLLQDKRRAEKKWARSPHRQIVDGSVDGQRTDVAAGKKERLDDEGIGRKCQAFSVYFHNRLVIETRKHGVLECRQEKTVEQIGAQSPAASVTKEHALNRGQGDRTGKRVQRGGLARHCRPFLAKPCAGDSGST